MGTFRIPWFHGDVEGSAPSYPPYNRGYLRFVPMQLAEGRPLAEQLGINPDRPDSFAFVANGRRADGRVQPSRTRQLLQTSRRRSK